MNNNAAVKMSNHVYDSDYDWLWENEKNKKNDDESKWQQKTKLSTAFIKVHLCDLNENLYALRILTETNSFLWISFHSSVPFGSMEWNSF